MVPHVGVHDGSVNEREELADLVEGDVKVISRPGGRGEPPPTASRSRSPVTAQARSPPLGHLLYMAHGGRALHAPHRAPAGRPPACAPSARNPWLPGRHHDPNPTFAPEPPDGTPSQTRRDEMTEASPGRQETTPTLDPSYYQAYTSKPVAG